MARNFIKIAFTEAVKQVQEENASRENYENYAKRGISEDLLSSREIDFIKARNAFYLGTVNSDGWPYIQFRGGPKGFLKVLDEKTLAFVDFTGNLQYISIGNLQENDRVFLFLMDYSQRRRLKIWGRAKVINNPQLIEELSEAQYLAEKARVLVITVEALDWNCPQHIPILYSEEEVGEIIARFKSRIEELEKRIES